jgi:signal transduction histidine kinase
VKIQTKLLLAFVLLGLVSMGITGWQAFLTARSALEAVTFDRLTSVRETKKKQVQQWFEQQRRLVLDACEDAGLRDAARRLARDPLPASPSIAPAVSSVFQRYIARHRFHAMLLADTGGRVLLPPTRNAARADARDTALSLPPSSLARAVRDALTLPAGDTCVLVDFAAATSPTEAPVALLAAPLRDGGRPVAVLVAVIAIDHLNAVMTSGSNWHAEGLGESGETYIVGDDERMRNDSRFFIQEPDRYFHLLRERGADTAMLALIRAHASSVLLQDARTEAVRAALRGETGTRVIDDYRGVPVVSSYTPLAIPGVRWVMLAEIDTQEAFRSIAALRERLVLWGLVTLFLGLIVSVVVARSISHPVLSLARTAAQFGGGDLAPRARVRTRDEIGTLASTFNDMADRIARNTDALEREIVERRSAEARLTASRETLRNLSAHLQSVREDERKGVAREIHDELGQALTTLKLELRLLADDTAPDSAAAAPRIVRMTELIDSTIRSVKRLITDLRPRLLDDLGLVAAIEWQAEDFTRRTGIDCRVRIDPPDFELDAARSVAIFRIFQEALTNVARHAGAAAIRARLERDGARVLLEVADDGRGISRDAAESPSSFGLLGIRERASYWGGQAAIDTAPGGGTVLLVTLPIPPETA